MDNALQKTKIEKIDVPLAGAFFHNLSKLPLSSRMIRMSDSKNFFSMFSNR